MNKFELMEKNMNKNLETARFHIAVLSEMIRENAVGDCDTRSMEICVLADTIREITDWECWDKDQNPKKKSEFFEFMGIDHDQK